MFYEITLDKTQASLPQRLVWMTDLHLDAADETQRRRFFDLVRHHRASTILIGGDISNGTQSLDFLKQLAGLSNGPLYFVLGNHDFYYGSIDKTRELATQLAEKNDSIHYLTVEGEIKLSPAVALIGHDGWADGRYGDFLHSTIMLNDYILIRDFDSLKKEELLKRLHQLGKEAADNLKESLKRALKWAEQVILLIHAPPFEEACFYEGEVTNTNWGPHFVAKAVGDMLREEMHNYPDKKLLVLCGHAHHGADIAISSNIRALTGHSELGEPSVQGVINLG